MMRYFRDNDVIRSRSYLLLKSVNTLYIYESLHMNKTNLYIDRFTWYQSIDQIKRDFF